MAGDQVDVAIVGAGFAGLSAAHALKDRGFTIALLEARNRVGGRVEPVEAPDGSRWDAGGQFLCDDMPEVTALARRYGLETIETRWRGEAHMVPETDTDAACEDLDALFDALDHADPLDPALDDVSVADWLDQRSASAEAKRRFTSMVEGLWCLPPQSIPFWHLAESDQRNTASVSELQFFLKDGMAGLAQAMANDLAPHLMLGRPVERIEVGDDRLTLNTRQGTLTARHVVVAVPPAKAGALAYAPPLPAPLGKALSAWKSGMVIKILILYPRRFWPKSISSGLMWRDMLGLFVFDGSVSDERACFIAFIGGPLAAQWQDHGEGFIRAEILRRLTALLGAEASAPSAFLMRDWIDDPWSGGGYSDVIVEPDARDAETRIRAGLPQITFACSEISPRFPTYVEGAIIAGREAADRAAAAVKAPQVRPGERNPAISQTPDVSAGRDSAI